ncbi:MAG: hypothetical protein E7633_10485 [Ruminococcaceae bacterium]|nr:hypothetical protein [Oscillospiraceae bacterium]
MNRNVTPQIDQYEKCERKISSARVDIILMVMLTIINMFLIFTETQRYFVFSAFIPYRILYEAAFFTGLMPESFYEPLIGENESLEFFSIENFYIALAVVGVILAIYLLCFFITKNKPIWLIVATVIFAADTVYLISYAVEYGVLEGCVLDILLHAYVLYGLISGIIYYYKLKALPPRPETVEAPVQKGVSDNIDVSEENTDSSDSDNE